MTMMNSGAIAKIVENEIALVRFLDEVEAQLHVFAYRTRVHGRRDG
jgi:hypothetical protein